MLYILGLSSVICQLDFEVLFKLSRTSNLSWLKIQVEMAVRSLQRVKTWVLKILAEFGRYFSGQRNENSGKNVFLLHTAVTTPLTFLRCLLSG
jgi:hypothetical protein